jgi:hypothetical protein
VTDPAAVGSADAGPGVPAVNGARVPVRAAVLLTRWGTVPRAFPAFARSRGHTEPVSAHEVSGQVSARGRSARPGAETTVSSGPRRPASRSATPSRTATARWTRNVTGPAAGRSPSQATCPV